MNLTVNGKPHDHRGNSSIPALLDELGAQPAHAAVMVNGDVVPSDQWETTMLNENDNVEILVFVGGG